MSAHRGTQVPIEPIQHWCTERIRIASRWRVGKPSAPDGPCTMVAARLGINPRILNRLRRGMYAGSKARRKGEYPTDTITRDFVEDMLTRAGLNFDDVYQGRTGTPRMVLLYIDAAWACEVEVELEDDAWCRCCREFVTPIFGLCPWDDTPVDSMDVAA